MVAEARKYVGVPFRHQGRNPAVGLDCIGLGVAYLRGLGYDVRDRTDYGRDPDGSLRAALVHSLGAAVAEGEGCWRHAQPGDVLSMRFANIGAAPERHVGIASDFGGELYLIHADNSHGKVVEIPMDDRWKRRVIGVWRVA